MADGDVLLDDEFDIGTKQVVMFAVDSNSYPGGVSYRFAYFDPATGTDILRYDNSRKPRRGVGVHHRHYYDEVQAIEFNSLDDHVRAF